MSSRSAQESFPTLIPATKPGLGRLHPCGDADERPSARARRTPKANNATCDRARLLRARRGNRPAFASRVVRARKRALPTLSQTCALLLLQQTFAPRAQTALSLQVSDSILRRFSSEARARRAAVVQCLVSVSAKFWHNSSVRHRLPHVRPLARGFSTQRTVRDADAVKTSRRTHVPCAPKALLICDPTLRQTKPREDPRPQCAFKESVLSVSCNSHQVSQLAAFFIDPRTE